MTKSENNIDQLKQEARNMSKYYYKGFGNRLQGILGSTVNYIENINSEENLHKIKKQLTQIKKSYEKIPFENLLKNKNYKPLFETQKLLTNATIELDLIIHKNKTNITNLTNTLERITNEGEIYRTTLKEIISIINNTNIHEPFEIKLYDYEGNKWSTKDI
ncbi:hypothetical protein K9L67_00615 [Candidatus Woesearchaeota archaeon]|nr:hypothetical protein [Candidatus Woesearchaeota archaeon]MCF7900709.1 hypothetical protein [Candidatus Woesearchaeota archaeon]MCF8013230.1 hypothetical protein [Candidatus Woesearchaeota archaeon]